MITLGHGNDDPGGLVEPDEAGSSFADAQIQADSEDHENFVLVDRTQGRCRLVLLEPRTNLEQRNGVQDVEADQAGFPDRLSPQPTGTNEATHRVRLRTGAPVGTHEVGDHLERLRRIAIRVNGRRRELIVRANSEIDSRNSVEEADSGNFEPVQFTDPHTMISNDLQTGVGEYVHVLVRLRRSRHCGGHRLGRTKRRVVRLPDRR